ncbi:hypothetical protein [Rubinisphaera sp.]|uniref:hypothetical protein n=1 Tax=Rubinisphaera sp. TaxID=2024857 RepID=UPI0025EA8FDB|nr:hypothetical protein [Rubinisphaera sp.]
MSSVTMSNEKYKWAISRLKKSERGQETLQLIRNAFDIGPMMSLDGMNKAAVIDLLIDLWGPECGTAMDALREVTVRNEA